MFPSSPATTIVSDPQYVAKHIHCHHGCMKANTSISTFVWSLLLQYWLLLALVQCVLEHLCNSPFLYTFTKGIQFKCLEARFERWHGPCVHVCTVCRGQGHTWADLDVSPRVNICHHSSGPCDLIMQNQVQMKTKYVFDQWKKCFSKIKRKIISWIGFIGTAGESAHFSALTLDKSNSGWIYLEQVQSNPKDGFPLPCLGFRLQFGSISSDKSFASNPVTHHHMSCISDHPDKKCMNLFGTAAITDFKEEEHHVQKQIIKSRAFANCKR